MMKGSVGMRVSGELLPDIELYAGKALLLM